MPGNVVNTELLGVPLFYDLLMSCNLIGTHHVSLEISHPSMQQRTEEGVRETVGMVSRVGESSVFNLFLLYHFIHITIHLI